MLSRPAGEVGQRHGTYPVRTNTRGTHTLNMALPPLQNGANNRALGWHPRVLGEKDSRRFFLFFFFSNPLYYKGEVIGFRLFRVYKESFKRTPCHL